MAPGGELLALRGELVALEQEDVILSVEAGIEAAHVARERVDRVDDGGLICGGGCCGCPSRRRRMCRGEREKREEGAGYERRKPQRKSRTERRDGVEAWINAS